MNLLTGPWTATVTAPRGTYARQPRGVDLLNRYVAHYTYIRIPYISLSTSQTSLYITLYISHYITHYTALYHSLHLAARIEVHTYHWHDPLATRSAKSADRRRECHTTQHATVTSARTHVNLTIEARRLTSSIARRNLAVAPLHHIGFGCFAPAPAAPTAHVVSLLFLDGKRRQNVHRVFHRVLLLLLESTHCQNDAVCVLPLPSRCWKAAFIPHSTETTLSRLTSLDFGAASRNSLPIYWETISISL